jgi:subtilisin family serine protease
MCRGIRVAGLMGRSCPHILALLVGSAVSLCAQPQQSPPAVPNPGGHRILLRMRPTASAEDRQKALAILMRLFEPEKVLVTPGEKLSDLSRAQCGRVDDLWIRALRKSNPSLSGLQITQAATLSVPPCPFWGSAKKVTIPTGGTLSHQLLARMGTLGNKTLAAVAAINDRPVSELGAIKPGDNVTLPYVNAFSAYTPRPEYQNNPKQLDAALNQIPGYVSTLPQRSMSLIVAASDSDCMVPTGETEWPFSTGQLRAILEYNDAKRQRTPRMAVIAIADTGLDKSEDRVFLRINYGENPVPNEIDDDGNGYVDDIQGANMDRSVHGFPALQDGYHDSEHGTHVTGLALGGLSDDSLSKLVKDRIQIEELNIVEKEVLQLGTSEPTTLFEIPNNFLMDAFHYANQNPPVQIINLSVEDENKSGLEEIVSSSSALVVAAAGNDGINIDEDERYPAASSSRAQIITVAAYDGSGGLAPFSNWGLQNVDLAAPGCQVDSILPEGSRGRLNGTSQAAPLVSFTAALLYSEGLSISQIRSRILTTVDIDHDRLGICSGPNGHCVATEGRLDMLKALDVHRDILVYRKLDGTEGTLSGREIGCVPMDDKCYDATTQLERLVHKPDADEGKVWTRSRDNQLHSRKCTIDGTAHITFQADGSQQVQTFFMKDVIDLVPAIYR